MGDTDSGPLALLPLTEQSRRRLDWVETGGTWLVLGDGQDPGWCLPSVWGESVTLAGTNGAMPSLEWRVGRPSCPVAESEYEAVLGAIQKADPETLKRRMLGFAVELGGVLLRRQYRLDPFEVRCLLCEGFWNRSLEDSTAFDQARECYRIIESIGMDRPMQDLTRLLNSIPKSSHWMTSDRMN